MIHFIRGNIFQVPYEYQSRVEQQRANNLNLINLIMMLVTGSWLIIALLANLVAGNMQGVPNLLHPLSYIIPPVTLVIFVMLRSGGLRNAVWLFIGLLMVGPALISQHGIWSNLTVYFIVPIIAAGGLLKRSHLAIVLGVTLIFIGAAYYIQTTQGNAMTLLRDERAFSDLLVVVLSLALSSFFLFTFSGQTQLIAQAAQRDLQAYDQLAKVAPSLNDATRDENALISDALQFYLRALNAASAQLFRVNAEGKVIERVRNIFGSQTSVEVDENIALGDTNIITQAARTRSFVQTSIDGPDIRRRHFMPATRCGAAIPVIHNNTLLGILDVQSDTHMVFSESQIEIMRAQADMLAAAIVTNRTLKAMREAVEQNEEGRQMRAMRGDRQDRPANEPSYWDVLLQRQGESLLGLNLQSGANNQAIFTPAKDVPDSLRLAMTGGDLQIIMDDNSQVISVPIMLNNEIFGAMSFKVPIDRVLTERQLDTVRIIARRLALALENRRLYEQSQAQVVRERKANEIANMLISATDVESVLRLAAANFNEALGAINTEIAVQSVSTPSTEPSEETV